MPKIRQAFLEDLALGQCFEKINVVSEDDISRFAEVSGDDNPLHVDEAYARTTLFKGRIAHGMISASYISAILGTQLPGAGSIYLSQSLKFRAPVRIGDSVVSRVEITAIDSLKKKVKLACVCKVKQVIVLEGEAEVMVPHLNNGPEEK